jgi:Ni,Fe-hydrogenase I large subunit
MTYYLIKLEIIWKAKAIINQSLHQFIPLESSTVDENIYKMDAYSWIKAPRYTGYPMEVGTLG